MISSLGFDPYKAQSVFTSNTQSEDLKALIYTTQMCLVWLVVFESCSEVLRLRVQSSGVVVNFKTLHSKKKDSTVCPDSLDC